MEGMQFRISAAPSAGNTTEELCAHCGKTSALDVSKPTGVVEIAVYVHVTPCYTYTET